MNRIGASNPGGPSGTDCNDRHAAIRPDAQELPDGSDADCDGLVDNLLGTW
ncbi:MAG: putative metal-binding motif-containing protein [Hyphomonas sp.]